MSQRISLDEWLDFFGFVRHPFASIEAGSEQIYWAEYLAECLVKPAYFDRILGQASTPKSVIVFAPRGTGKTACRLLVEYYCREGIGQGDRPASETGGRVLPVPHVRLDEVVRQAEGNITQVNEHLHVREILRRAVQSLTGLLKEDRELAQRVQGMSKWQRLDLEWFFHVYPTYLSAEDLGFLSERVGFFRIMRIVDQSGRFGFLAERTEIDEDGFPAAAIALMDVRVQTPVIDQFSLLTGLVGHLGFQAVYVLVDGLDELPETAGDPAAGAALLTPLLANLTLMNTTPRLVFKCFLPAEMRSFILESTRKVRRDRLSFETINWTREGLLEILHKRLAVSSSFTIQSLDAVSAPELRGELETSLIEEAQGNPRYLMLLADFLVKTHCDRLLNDPIVERLVRQLGEEAVYLLNEVDLAEAMARFHTEVFALTEAQIAEKSTQQPIEASGKIAVPKPADRVFSDLPAPIAMVYLDYLRRQEPLEKFRRLLDLFEVTVGFISVLLLSQLRALAGSRTPERLHSADLRLQETSLGLWIVIWEKLPGLCASLGKSHYAPKLQRIYIQEASRLAALHNLRNIFAHGAIRGERDYAEMLEQFDLEIRHLLSQLEFLAQARLVRVKDLKMKDGRFIHQARIYVGDNPNFPWEYITLDAPLECEKMLLLKGSDVLSLHPLLVVETCSTCKQEELFFYQKLEDDHMSYISYHTDHRLVTDRYRADFQQMTGL